MSIRLTNQSFRSVVAASRPLTEKRLDKVPHQFPRETNAPQDWSDKLIELEDLKAWQAENCCRGVIAVFNWVNFSSDPGSPAAE